MTVKLTYTQRPPLAFPDWQFPTLDLVYDPATCSVWLSFKADGPPCFTFQTLTDMADFRESLRGFFAAGRNRSQPVHYVVLASNKPGIFNLGGDLAMFAQAIRDGDDDHLRSYAHACIDVVHGMATAYGLPVVTLAVITGQALGGGLEAALAQDFLIADEDAALGVPEVAFNTFPGMGAVTLLTRRLGAARAEAIIASGEVYSGAEMFAQSVVDNVAPAGQARDFTLDWMRQGGEAKRTRRLAVTGARRRIFPVKLGELMQIVDLWTDCCRGVTARDLRHMEKLVSAQKRLAA